MKNLFVIMAVLTLIFNVNCSNSGEEKVEELALSVDGMVCEYGCAKFIQKKVAGLSGVKECLVNFDNHSALISFDRNTISDDEIMTTITDLNEGQYKVKKVDLLEKPVKSKSLDSEKEEVKDPSPAQVSFQFPALITYFMRHIAH